MKNLIIAIALFITLSSVCSAQTLTPTPISELQTVQATPTGYTLVVTGEKIEFVRFHEFYSEAYQETYDKNGELIDVMVGDQIYVYKTKTYKAYPTYQNTPKPTEVKVVYTPVFDEDGEIEYYNISEVWK